jgi:hypothetical protein
MRFSVRVSLIALIVLGLGASARARNVYVRADAALNSGDGTRERPFRRITDALHQIEMFAENNAGEHFIVDIGPGTYVGAYSGALLAAHPEWEVLPLWVSVSNAEVRGATRIVSGLGRGEPLGLADDTVMTVAEEIVSVTPGWNCQRHRTGDNGARSDRRRPQLTQRTHHEATLRRDLSRRHRRLCRSCVLLLYRAYCVRTARAGNPLPWIKRFVEP